MEIVGKFIREGSVNNPCKDGPYVVKDCEICPECFVESAVTVRDKKDNVVWLLCKSCGIEMDLTNSVRA
jgi:transcription elongation factor Elf1